MMMSFQWESFICFADQVSKVQFYPLKCQVRTPYCIILHDSFEFQSKATFKRILYEPKYFAAYENETN
jgi:hypothetical protein